MAITFHPGRTTKGGAHQPHAVSLRRGHDIEARGIDEAGLDAIRAIIIAEHPVMIADLRPAPGEMHRAEIMIAIGEISE